MTTVRTGKIRLACDICDRDDADGIDGHELRRLKRAGWRDVSRVQTYAQACKTYDDPDDAPLDYSVLDWYTHLGTCPECAAPVDAHDAEVAARSQAWLESPEGLALKARNEE